MAVGKGKGEGDTFGRGGAEVCIFYLCMGRVACGAARWTAIGVWGLVEIARQVRCVLGGMGCGSGGGRGGI